MVRVLLNGFGRIGRLTFRFAWDMPELEMRPGAPKRIEVCQADGDTFSPATLDKVGLDGRVRIRYDSAPTRPVWVDLKDKRYRWLADVGARWEDPDYDVDLLREEGTW